MASTIKEDEIQQLLRTIEMFAAITESQPDDYQSLEILKEAYTKLGRREESLRTSKQLAQAYINLGQISQAILEYEGILQEYPKDSEVLAALAELEAKTSQFSASKAAGAPGSHASSKQTQAAPSTTAGEDAPSAGRPKTQDADRALADVLIAEKLVTPNAVQPLLARLRTERPASIEKVQPLTLVQLLVDEQIAKLDDIITILVDKSGLPYLPLSIYDVDSDTACLLPQDLCKANCIVPFDLISRSVLIATTNPYDMAVRKQAEQMLTYNVFWYVSSPEDIISTLRRAYGLDKKKPTSLSAQGKQ